MVVRSVDRANERGMLAFLGNRAESLGFWAGIAGLLLATVVTVVNLAASGPDASALAAAEERIAVLEARDIERAEDVARMQAALQKLTSRVDSLAGQ